MTNQTKLIKQGKLDGGQLYADLLRNGLRDFNQSVFEQVSKIERVFNSHEDLVRGNAALRESKNELMNTVDKLTSILKGILDTTGQVHNGEEYGFVIHKDDATYRDIKQAIAKAEGR